MSKTKPSSVYINSLYESFFRALKPHWVSLILIFKKKFVNNINKIPVIFLLIGEFRFKDPLIFLEPITKSAIKEFENEIQYLKNKSPQELMNLEKISKEINQYFERLINYKFFDSEIIGKLKLQAKENLNNI